MRAGAGILCGAAMLLAPASMPGPAEAFESYASVKRALFDQVFADHPVTLYCACPFDRMRRLDLETCGYRSPGNSERALRVEVEHVVPASWIGEGRRCWREKICTDAGGRPFKGRQCCLASDPAFRVAYQDLHNLWPAVGEVNERRRNYRFGVIDGERRDFGRCDFETDSEGRRAEPRAEIRGDVARISLYMAATHGVRLSRSQRSLFEAWHLADPPDADERRRHSLIAGIQGRRNPLVDAEPAGF